MYNPLNGIMNYVIGLLRFVCRFCGNKKKVFSFKARQKFIFSIVAYVIKIDV